MAKKLQHFHGLQGLQGLSGLKVEKRTDYLEKLNALAYWEKKTIMAST